MLKDDIDKKKETLILVNGLIQQRFVEFDETKSQKLFDTKIEQVHNDILDYLKKSFGEDEWQKAPSAEKNSYTKAVTEPYLRFLEGTQADEEKASLKPTKEIKRDYYKLPQLNEEIKRRLKEEFHIPDAKIQRLYHHSDIEMYNPNSVTEKEVLLQEETKTVKQLGSPQPPSKGWKNPMAMRTMYELRKLLNYLLQIGEIDPETKIVIEMARELNDANRRWAIETYQHYREEENKEFAKAIYGVAKDKYSNIDEHNIENINQVRLWWEQIPNSEEIYKDIKALKDDVEKYKLWKHQECQCIYTGKMISITDLFDGTATNIDHTLPISDSFDDSLSNRTVIDAYYNQHIKKDRLPTQLENYDKDAGGYTAIKPRLLKWEEKVKHLREIIEDNKLRTKKAQDPESKKGYIQKRRLHELELEYWDKKLKTFTVKELPNSWKNSQLIDTQIITKYARAYLKTLFHKVDVQKASVANTFKKIYGIRGDEQKDRSKHSHHAIDATVLTLMPGSARREAILKEYYIAEEQKLPYRAIPPYYNYRASHVLDIENNVLINHVTDDKTISETKKKIRKRGKIVFLRDKKTNKFILDKDGKKIPMVAQGDTIRGQINEESFLGAINPPERDADGNSIKEDGKWKTKKDKYGDPEIWIVKRIPLKEIDFEKDIIVDEPLKIHILKQIDSGITIDKITDFQGNILRHIRCRVKTGRGYQSLEKTIELKQHSHPSDKQYKKHVPSKIADNFVCLIYENSEDKTPIRELQILSLFEYKKQGLTSLNDLYSKTEWKAYKTDDNIILPLKRIITVGQRVIFYEKSFEEFKQLDANELNKRLFIVYKFNESYDKRVNKYYNIVNFKNHIDARPNPEIDKVCKKNLMQQNIKLD